MMEINDILERKERIVRFAFSGIYFLICREKIIYVGKAAHSIEDRLNKHRARKRMMFDSIYCIKADSSEIDQLEIFYITKFTPKYNFTDNPNAENSDRYTCFSIIHNKYSSMNHLSTEIGVNPTTLRIVMDPTVDLNKYQQSVYEKVKEYLLNKHQKYRRPKINPAI